MKVKSKTLYVVLSTCILMSIVACNSGPVVENLGFEAGDLTSWKVEGNAFSVTDETQFGDRNRYYMQADKYHVKGSIENQGTISSSKFIVDESGYISFLMSGSSTQDTYVAIIDAKDHQELMKVYNEYYDNNAFTNNYIRQNIDLSAYLNQEVYVKVVDASSNDAVNIDDFHFHIQEAELTELLIDQNIRIGLDTSDNMIEAANTYIRMNSWKIAPEDRFRFHVTGEMGWINDPNGFSYYHDQIHLFYQHNPYDTKWGPMHWGHVTSQDFVKWEYQDVALAPDQDYDYVGAFSGSAIEYNDQYYLVYTGASDGKQVQAIATSSDGIHFTKDQNNPVITEKNLPANTNVTDFRDPKVWEKDGVVYMIVSARNSTNQYSKLLLYKTTNMTDWTYAGKVFANNSNMGEKLGIMFECPDLFELDGRDVILVSPQSVSGHRNADSNVYIVGDLNYDTGALENWSYDAIQEIDKGFDFYAPQTMEMPDGRRVMVAWMASWNRAPIYASLGFAGAITFPRELRLKENHLYQTPIKEIENYYVDGYESNLAVTDQPLNVTNLSGFYQDISLEFQPQSGKTGITVFADEQGNGMKVYYEGGKVYLERYGVTNGYISQSELFNVTSADAPLVEGKVKIRLILDRYSAEVFIADGYITITATGFPTDTQDKAYLFSDTATNIQVGRYAIS